MAKKLQIFCDRCACPVEDWRCVPSRHNTRFYDLEVRCHGETERFRLSANDLVHERDPRPWYIIAFEDASPNRKVRALELPGKSLSIRIDNPTNRLVDGTGG